MSAKLLIQAFDKSGEEALRDILIKPEAVKEIQEQKVSSEVGELVTSLFKEIAVLTN